MTPIFNVPWAAPLAAIWWTVICLMSNISMVLMATRNSTSRTSISMAQTSICPGLRATNRIVDCDRSRSRWSLQRNRNGGRTGGSRMKMGDVVSFEDRCYRVGSCMTHTSIELVELRNPLIGLWVSRNEVYKIPAKSRHDQQNARA